MPAREPITLCTWLICLGGFHYGYNVAVVGAAKDVLSAEFAPPTEVFSLLSAAALLGAIIGSPVSAIVCSRYGRRLSTLIGESLSVIGALGCSLTNSMHIIIISRVVIGLGVGFCTLAKPLYVREMLSEERSSPVQASFAPAVALGILTAQSSSLVTSDWRLQLLFGGCPPFVLLCVAIIWMKESPTWLASREELQAARLSEDRQVSSTRVEASPRTVGSSTAINDHAENATPTTPMLVPTQPLASAYQPVALAALMGLANQLTGAYPILVYAPVLAHRGLNTSSSSASDDEQLVPMVVTVANLLGSCVAIPLLARCPRRPLLCLGCAMMAACLWWTVTLEAAAREQPTLLALALGAWCFAYEVSVGSGYFVIVSDLATAPWATLTFAVGNLVRFAGECASSVLFLTAVESLGMTRTLAFYALVTVVILVALLAVLPETHPRFRRVVGLF